MKYFFTADEHYGHKNIIKYCSRPFRSVEEMDDTIISRHNEVVGQDDHVIHAGDFTLNDNKFFQTIIRRLSGIHTFLVGSHDRWLEKSGNHEIMELRIDGQHIVVCHYAMRTWPRSHYGSWQLYGHSHGTLPPLGLQMDIGVDTHDYYPYSFEEINSTMKK
jgi:calcineurin-like phosphoesterase family protein